MELTGKIEPFDSFWEAPEDIERGYDQFGRFYRSNYLPLMPDDKQASVLVISCGPGYFVKLLTDTGFADVEGIDSVEEKIRYAVSRGLNCRVARIFPYLQKGTRTFDVIFCEQELNHLTKDEMVSFLLLCYERLSPGGRLIVHGLNGANPLTGAEALAQNFDHYNSFTAYSLEQVLGFCGFVRPRAFALHLYVFYSNPLNYVAWAISGLLNVSFRAVFVLYGKGNKIWSKKLGAIAYRPGT